MAGIELQKHVIIVGHGRSGTNMVLDIFDCHRNTFCRNEPNELVGSAFTDLGSSMFLELEPDAFNENWHKAITETIRASGVRDRFPSDKDYFHSVVHARIGQSLMSRSKIRACILPRSAGAGPEEWPCPSLYYDHTSLAHALPILKILLTPAWVIRAHHLIETQKVVHVVRSPQGFLQSWWSRYVTYADGGPEKVFADNQPSLAKILQYFGQEDQMPRQYSLLNLIVSELWRWRYVNEIMMTELSGSPRYLRLRYESVVREKLYWMEEIYRFAGLEPTPDCRLSVKAMENTLFKERKSDGLDSVLVDMAIEEVMADSPWRAELLL